jgi:glycosyltransferase involved in cell wall biosynthesis
MSIAVFTHLDLTALATSTYGIYQRFRVLLEASQRVDPELIVVCGVRVPDEQTPAWVEQQSRDQLWQHWQIAAQVVCVPHAPPPSEPWIIQQIKSALAYRWHPIVRALSYAEGMQRLKAVAGEASAVVVHRLPLMFSLMRAGETRTPLYFDLDDIEPIALWRHARTNPSRRARFFIRLSLPGIYLAMWKAIKRARCTFVCSELDRVRLQKRAGATIRVVPNSARLKRDAGPVPDRPIVLMVGVYSFRPNADGADFFIEQVWPEVKRQVPEAELWLVGGGSEHLRAHATRPAAVNFLGFVDDLDQVYAQARLVICPLRSGGGTRVKLLEAAGQRRPIVSTAVGAEGIGFKADSDALIADDPHAFAAACIRVLHNQQVAEQLAAHAFDLVDRRYAQPAVVEALAAYIAQDTQMHRSSSRQP